MLTREDLESPVTTSEARHSRRIALGAAILCGVVAIALVLVATSRGVGVSPDSAYYISGARNVLDGHGLTQFPDARGWRAPILSWPPLYPLVLAAVGATGLDVLVAARALNAALFGASVFLVGLMVRRLGAPAWLVLVASLAVAASNDMVLVHAMAWSEPPCIFFGLLGFLLLDLHLERPRRPLLLAAAVLLACTVLTRYAGLAYVAVGALALGVLGKRRFAARLADLAIFAVAAAIPIVAMLARNTYVGGSAAARTLVFRPALIPGQLRDGLDTVSLWFLPGFVNGLAFQASLFGMVVAGAVGWHCWLRRRARAAEPGPARRPASSLPAMLVAFVVCYLVLMIVTIAVVAPMPILDYRNLAPVFPAAVVLTAWMVAREMRSPRRVRLVRIACIVGCVVLVATYTVRAACLTARLKRTGLSYGVDEWVHADILQHVKALAADRPIYSNSPDAIYLLTGRGASFVPREQATRAQLSAVRTHLEETDGVVVHFDKGGRKGYMDPADLAERLHLKLLVRASDGAIYETARD